MAGCFGIGGTPRAASRSLPDHARGGRFFSGSFDASGRETVVHCPETKGIEATLHPARRRLSARDDRETSDTPPPFVATTPSAKNAPVVANEIITDPNERHYTISYGDMGHTYDSIVGPYLDRATTIIVEDPYIRAQHQIANFVRFCETLVKVPTIRKIHLITSYDDKTDMALLKEKMDELKQSLLEIDVMLSIELSAVLHDREIRIDNGWTVKIGRGLDFYQKPDGWFTIGANDYALRRCLETKVDIFRTDTPPAQNLQTAPS
jgi:ATP-dependent Lon protease